MSAETQALPLQVRPVALVRAEPDGSWYATGPHPWLELVAPHGVIPAGWVLLRGRLDRRGGGYSAYLHAEDADGQASTFELPVTLKGTILELLNLPPRTVRLLLEPLQGEGEFALGAFSLKRVGQMECLWRMARRVAPMYYRQTRERRKRAGLHVRTGVLHLREAYRLAGRFRTFAPIIPYDRWIEDNDALTASDVTRIEADVARMRRRPPFRVVLLEQATDVLRSLDDQLYPDWDVLPDPGRAVAVPEPDRTWVILARPGLLFAPHALYWLARAAGDNPGRRLLYADHDRLDAAGVRCQPVFKPDWSPELLRSTNYIGPAVAFRADLLADLLAADGDGTPDIHELLLRAAECLEPGAIGHIHAVLFHLTGTVAATAVGPVCAHLARQGVTADVEPQPRGHCRVRYALPDSPPLVSVVIATRDQHRILARCLDSIGERTTYPRYEVLVVDNQSADPESRAYLRDLAGRPGLTVLPYDHPFNFSAINNFAAGQARGDLLCLLNNDTEVISPDWLDEMVGRLLQPCVGVVGAKLYYSDGLVQHGGDVVGPGGCANHLHSCLAPDDPGYCDRAVLAQELSAVTAACLLTRRKLFLRLGGLDARHLPVAFNDVDYCLRVREAGWRVIWTPYAELYHYESYTRGADDTPDKRLRAKREANYMRKRWKRVMRHDPYYNPNLSYLRPDFSLNHAPLVKKPWQW